MQITTVTSKGQVTIPVRIRKKKGFKPGQKVQFYQKNGEVLLKKVPDFFSFRGSLKGKGVPTPKQIEEIAAKEAVKRYLKTL